MAKHIKKQYDHISRKAIDSLINSVKYTQGQKHATFEKGAILAFHNQKKKSVVHKVTEESQAILKKLKGYDSESEEENVLDVDNYNKTQEIMALKSDKNSKNNKYSYYHLKFATMDRYVHDRNTSNFNYQSTFKNITREKRE